MSNVNIKENNNIVAKTKNLWLKYKEKNPGIAQFLVFFLLSNGITALQMILMPLLKSAFALTDLVNTNFQVLQVGHNFDGSAYYAYLIISIGAAALQGLYKAPIYNLLMNTWGMGSAGEVMADFITMIINCAISFWVFFPIFKIIFKNESEK